MMPNDLAFADNSQLARNKTPKPRITPRVKAAVDAMVNDGLPFNEAANANGLTARAMRLALERPHVMAYYKSECQVLRTAQHARNIHRLAQIRDADDNMPAVNAIKALEQLADAPGERSQHATPGITLRIININATQPQQAATTIEANVDDASSTDD